MTDEIFIEGNNGGNYIKIKKLTDNTIYLEIVDCCVNSFRGVISAELLSNFLTNFWLKSGKSLIDAMGDYLSWNKEYNEEIILKSKKEL